MLKRIIKSRFVQSLKIAKVIYLPFYINTQKKLQVKVLPPLETVKRINEEKLSIGRFGDGEMRIMFQQRDIGFQKFDPKLANELFKSATPSGKYVIAIPHGFMTTKDDNLRTAVFWWKYVFENKKHIRTLTDHAKTKLFFDTNFSRTTTELKNTDTVDNVIREVKNIWSNRSVIMIEGKQTRFGIGNDLFDNALVVRRVVGPAENAYDAIDSLEEVVVELSKQLIDPIVLIALGPTATVLSHRIFSLGLQTIDIGHFDLQYEYYLKGSRHRVKVSGKYDNERGTTGQEENFSDESYKNQIYKKIL